MIHERHALSGILARNDLSLLLFGPYISPCEFGEVCKLNLQLQSSFLLEMASVWYPDSQPPVPKRQGPLGSVADPQPSLGIRGEVVTVTLSESTYVILFLMWRITRCQSGTLLVGHSGTRWSLTGTFSSRDH